MSRIFYFDTYTISVEEHEVSYPRSQYNEFTNRFIFKNTLCIENDNPSNNMYSVAIVIEKCGTLTQEFVHTKPRCKNCTESQISFFINCLTNQPKFHFRLVGKEMIVFYYNGFNQAWYHFTKM
jgi:hypothetical protein